MNTNIKSFKLLLLGESGTGAKTCLLRRYIDNSFPSRTIPTIGFDSRNKIVQTDFGAIKLQIFDTAGQEKFRTICSNFVKGSHCIILGYDVTERYSFEEIRKYWYNFVMKNKDGNSPLMYLVGNKIDKPDRVVSDEEGKSLANDLNMKYFGVSAKTGENVDILFNDIVNSLIKKFIYPSIEKIQKYLNKYLNY